MVLQGLRGACVQTGSQWKAGVKSQVVLEGITGVLPGERT